MTCLYGVFGNHKLPVRFGSAVVVGPAGLRVRSSGAAV